MTATAFQSIPIAAIEEHTRNVRRDLGDLGELADSIREVGLLEPVVVAPGSVGKGEGLCPDCNLIKPTSGDLLLEHDHAGLADQVGGEYEEGPHLMCPGGGQPAADAFRLIAGHRRKAAAALAGLDAVDSIIRYDLKTEADQLIAMLVENLQRADLTPIEEADAYAQLTLFGYKPAQIAKKTGRSRAVVDRRLALTKLDQDVQAKVQSRDLTLTDAEALVEFAGDKAATKRLEKELGTSGWRWALERERQKRHAAAAAKKVRASLVRAGVKIVPDPGTKGRDETGPRLLGRFWGHLNVDPDEHAKTCPHHAAAEPRNGDVTYVCLDPTVHADPDEDEDTVGEPSPAEQAREQYRESYRTAMAIRRDWLLEFTTGHRVMTVAEQDLVLRAHLTALTAEDAYYEGPGPEQIVGWLQPDSDDDDVRDLRQVVEQQIQRRNPALVVLAVMACVQEHEQVWLWTDAFEESVAPWLQLLTDLGYELTDWETEQLAAHGTKEAPGEPAERQAARGVTREALTAATIAGIPDHVALKPGVKTVQGRCPKCMGWAALGSGNGVIGAHKGCQARGHDAMTLDEIEELEGEPSEAAV